MKKNLLTFLMLSLMGLSYAQHTYPSTDQALGHEVMFFGPVDPHELLSGHAYYPKGKNKMSAPINYFSTTPGYHFKLVGPIWVRHESYVEFSNPNQSFFVKSEFLPELLPHLTATEPLELWLYELNERYKYYDTHGKQYFFSEDSLLTQGHYLPLEWISYGVNDQGEASFVIVKTGKGPYCIQAISVDNMNKALKESRFADRLSESHSSQATTKKPIGMGPVSLAETVTFTLDDMVDKKVDISKQTNGAAPSFPGGQEDLFRFIAKNLNYPAVAIERNIKGKVVIEFIVEKDGSIGVGRVREEIGGGCGTESLRVIMSLPSWEPGYRDGKPSRGLFSLPINFNLE